ncbi:MAG: tetratricopeptide repeat protein [Gammaproteobacteria bacterium]|nr:tetratricopeptide repeat protein [Gammaproteobacteria bacterium]
MADSSTGKRRSAKSRYLTAALLLVTAVLLFGWGLNAWITNPQATALPTSAIERNGDASLQQLFAGAVEHMQQGRHQQALALWHKALLMAPEVPEIQVNMGFSLFELGEYAAARDFFVNAMEQYPFQANAYYGLALSSEKMGDLEGALGAMRSYIHLAADGEDDRFIRRARSALWEWEAQLAENSKTQPPAEQE